MTEEDRGDRAAQIQRTMELLVHATTCRAELRVAQLHQGEAPVPTRHDLPGESGGGCHLCRKMWTLLQVHSKDARRRTARCPAAATRSTAAGRRTRSRRDGASSTGRTWRRRRGSGDGDERANHARRRWRVAREPTDECPKKKDSRNGRVARRRRTFFLSTRRRDGDRGRSRVSRVIEYLVYTIRLPVSPNASLAYDAAAKKTL